MKMTALAFTLSALLGCASSTPPTAGPVKSQPEIDATVRQMMSETAAQGLALAVIDAGTVTQVSVYGKRNAKGDALTSDSIMYAASLTKSAFAYLLLQLAADGIIQLDTPISQYLPKALPEYADAKTEDLYARWSDLAGDDRWRSITPRMLLNHASGFANFGFLEPDGKLRFHFQPGSRYAYSGDGLILLQFVLEQGFGLDVGQEMQKRLFQPLGMSNSSMIWRDDFAGRTADGWTIEGTVEPHDDRSRVRAAGSLDSSISDMAKLAAALVKGDLLTTKARQEFSRPQLKITTLSQFPTLQAEVPADQQRPDLYAGLGVVVFNGPQGKGFFKGGHNDSTGNMLVCLEASQRCVVILGNDLRAERAIPYLVDFILGPTGLPWHWEYGNKNFWQPTTVK
jgi:CubicO group peptidase (beta-lactamase class C family)